MAEMKQSIVLYPASPGSHYLGSTVELGKLISQRHPNFSITVLVDTSSPKALANSSYINHLLSSDQTSISFFTLPSLNLPHPDAQTRPEFFLTVPNVVQALKTISLTSKVLAFITSAVQHPYDPEIPTYYYFPSCASALALFLYLPTIHDQMPESFKDLNDDVVEFPGLPALRGSQMPVSILDRNEAAYDHYLHIASCLPKAKGIIINTIQELEPRAIKAIKEGICVPNHRTPPLYHIGPFISDSENRSIQGGSPMPTNCSTLLWLDEQPSRSVVFLCFGSRGTFSEEQFKELAIGLERSKLRFLWVVRNQLDLEVLLPQGFLERTKDRGLVVTSWAPQVAILSHESVGGFVTHCGWNSITEAVTYGVPMVAWPLYSEQEVNSVVLVEEMKLAIPIFEVLSKSKQGLVSADEVEKKVLRLMDMESEEGKSLRERCQAVKAMGLAAWRNGGSSFTAFSELVSSWMH
ncbi:UDP-glycosyltransferase 88F3-like [Rosa rugosa]|uniref:UDP-glycosyltransferase 88F3-like n=1 Tax=Rosa rugosa TaxID=74645 RepID=UPI002B409393|nr:UDP-glycosyltransferase 88F3-like [Rosa rugosa]